MAENCNRLVEPLSSVQEDTSYISFLNQRMIYEIRDKIGVSGDGSASEMEVRNLGKDSFFWFIGLYVLLMRFGAVNKDKFEPGIVDLIRHLVVSPRSLKKKPCPQRWAKLRSVLVKSVSPYALGISGVSPSEEDAGEHDDAEVLSLMSHALALPSAEKYQGNKIESMPPKAVAAVRFVLADLDAVQEQLLSLLCEKYLNDPVRVSDHVFEWLHDAEPAVETDAETASDVEVVAEEGIAIDEAWEAVGADDAEVTWRYVALLDSGTVSYDEITFSNGQELDRIFRKKKIKASIKSESIIRSVKLHQLKPQEHKNVMKKEKRGGHYWSKIKRGKMRVFVIEEGEHIYVHIDPRDKWAYNVS